MKMVMEGAGWREMRLRAERRGEVRQGRRRSCFQKAKDFAKCNKILSRMSDIHQLITDSP